MSKVIQLFKTLSLALRRLKIKSLDLYSYFKSRINRTSHRRRSAHSGSLGGYISFLRNWRRAARISAFLLTLTIMAILFPISFKSATPVEAASGTPKQSTLTFAYVDNKSTASVSLNVSDPSGTFATSNDNEKAVFSLSTDNYTGYTLRLKTTGATTLTDGTNTIESIPTDGITSSSTAWNTNRWGLLPSYYNSSSNTTNYYRATTDGFLMDQTSSANSTPKQYTVGMGLKADYNTPAGTYTSSAIIAEYVARPISYSIAYDKGNITGTPTNIPSAQSDLISSTSVTLSSTTPSITGYNFTGWCLGTVSTNTTTKVDSCTGTTFSAGGSFGIDQTASNDVTLHAMWSIKTFTLTVQNGGNTTVTGSGTYQYGETVTITATPTTNTTCTTYGTPAWTKTSGEGTLNSASGTSVTFTMGLGDATVTATSTASNVAQTVTLSKGTGVSGITIAGTNYTGTSASLNCGSYTISGNYNSGYEFSSWAVANNVSVASTSSASTTLTVSGAGTLTLNAKSSGYTISYNANGGSGSIASQEVSQGSSVTLADNAFTRSNYYFKGWATSSTATTPTYRTNQSITPSGNMTLYAVWGSSTSNSLYNIVASLTRGNQTNDTNATTGIKTNPTKATSGVYTYNASTFGTASDASTSNTIYYYRGILDATTGTYGSDGDSMDYPNYVILDANGTKDTSDTCWRIVRTTGSGGVKMIYNGKWTGSTCANATTNAQVTTQAFGLKGNSAQSTWYYNINRVGYTFNNTQSLQDSTTATDVDTVFGSDSSPSTNNERSNIKKYIEDTWYASNMTSWTSKLEASAGYCNDRTAFSNTTGATALTTTPPYATSSATMYFGAYARNMNSAKTPSLTCPRSTVDLYRYVSGSTGVSNQLKYPVALLTADEASFAGSGSSTASSGSGYNANSYLRSGSFFWLLSPLNRDLSGYARGFYLSSFGYLISSYVNGTYGVRPVISLVSGTTPTGGTGTATDPWVVR